MAPSVLRLAGLQNDRLTLYLELLFAVILLTLLLLRRRTRDTPLPPGPRGSMISGHRKEMATTRRIWEQYAGWAKIYGPIFSLKSNNIDVVILNNARTAHTLLDKRSNIYSDRPRSVMGSELCDMGKMFFRIRSQHPWFSAYRRMAHEDFGALQIPRHASGIQTNIQQLLKSLLSDPQGLRDHLRLCQGQSILMATYGYQVKSKDDQFLLLAEERLRLANAFLRPGMWLVDSYPILKYWPSWMPGGGFRKIASEVKSRTEESLASTMEWTKAELSAGTALPSFVEGQLNRQALGNDRNEEMIGYVASSMYVAGADTVISTVLTFLLMMTLNPDIQKRAQQEIDIIIGRDRLPQISDRERLPYVEAVVREVFRFHPVAPLGVPHSVIRDDIFDGMLIPSGSIVIANIWGLTHDESIYPDPMRFNPDRFYSGEAKQGESQPNPLKYVFGFGRRVCAGMHFAEASVFLHVASLLATFNILKAVDENGMEIIPVINFTDGIVSKPEDFPCRIEPRPDAVDLILSSN
ncbi:cytochrome P450 [Sistotremastrum suecicum HHB10207 ss-3]|uniref:Cytochrome P450 n=1 Tax=Sistotremastrum suecicum HHB10207 ss-3 TaxID=1314776 RepID=A0A166CAX5_9AGAM|nr:cytochrome P450 [Sistotremastrum suecicum HHB10207 ss-3]